MGLKIERCLKITTKIYLRLLQEKKNIDDLKLKFTKTFLGFIVSCTCSPSVIASRFEGI